MISLASHTSIQYNLILAMDGMMPAAHAPHTADPHANRSFRLAGVCMQNQAPVVHPNSIIHERKAKASRDEIAWYDPSMAPTCGYSLAGTCMRPDRAICHSQAKVFDEREKLIAHGTLTFMVLQGKGLNLDAKRLLEE